MRTIAITNQKGGVGKTTTTVNLGAALAQLGHRVLLVDLDPQAHLTAHLGLDGRDGLPGTYELLTGSADLAAAVRPAGERLSVLGTSIDLAGAEVELANSVGREVILRDLLRDQPPDVDWLLIDCPPSLGILTLNALCAVTEVVIPLQPHFLALQGVGKLFETAALVTRRINPGLRIAGLILCMHEPGTRLAAEVIADLEKFLAEARGRDVPWRDARIFGSAIRRNIKLAESPSYGRTIFAYAPKSHGAADYLALADELAVHFASCPERADPARSVAVGASSAVETVVPSPPAGSEWRAASGE